MQRTTAFRNRSRPTPNRPAGRGHELASGAGRQRWRAPDAHHHERIPVIEAASTSGSRPFLAYDGDGHFLGDFAEWLPAHRWAHQRAAEPGTRLPVEIEDRGRTYAEQVWPEHCQALHSTPRSWSPPVR
jgi:hypothetical protein